MTTFLRHCYGDGVRLFNKAKYLPFLTATGLHFNKKKFFSSIFHCKLMLKHI